jgi:hypothetical protein
MTMPVAFHREGCGWLALKDGKTTYTTWRQADLFYPEATMHAHKDDNPVSVHNPLLVAALMEAVREDMRPYTACAGTCDHAVCKMIRALAALDQEAKS